MITSSTTAQAIAARPSAPAQVATALPALFAVLLGLFIVGVAGFSQIDVIHNAAHNTRHANAFPCH